MLKNYFKIALRNIIRNKSHTFINVGGLTLGVVCAVAIFLVIRYEFSYDTHHTDADQIYRVVRAFETDDGIARDPATPKPLPVALRNDFAPSLEALTVIDQNYSTPVLAVEKNDGQISRFKEENTAFTEPDYFQIFDYQWLLGNPQTALKRPNTAVISRSLAQKLFEDTNPVGQTVTLQTSNKYDLEITGVVEDPPPTTDLPFVLLASYSSIDRSGEDRHSENWGSTSTSVQTYLKLAEGVEAVGLQDQLEDFIVRHMGEETAQTMDLNLQSLNNLHFNTEYNTYSDRTVSRTSLIALGLIGLFLLIAACINFINLNTATAVRRSKEVGVRKVLGGTRQQLLWHFLGETSLITLLSLLLAFAITELILPFLEPVLGYQLTMSIVSGSEWLVFAGGLWLALSLASGVYPALYLSGFSPIEAIRNRINIRYGEGLLLRRSLVVVQFAIAQVLIICTIVIGTQMRYLQSADMGFEKEAIVEVPIPVQEELKLERFRNELDALSAINDFAYSSTGTASDNLWTGTYRFETEEEIKENPAEVKMADEGYLSTYGLELLAGSNLLPSDTVRQYLVNETFAREVGFADRYNELIGRPVSIWNNTAPIAGVVRDFNTSSLHHDINPLLITTRPLYFVAGIKIDPRLTQQALGTIENAFTDAFPDYVFEYSFLDESIARFYEQERRTSTLLNLFTFVAILIGCLGLFGMISFMAATRTKEIGVRKVLGATVTQIIGLLSKEFLLLTGLSFFIAAPAAWYFMQRWLSDFTYRIDVGPGLFVLAFVATLFITILTIGYKGIRTAAMNPVESLRSE